MEDNRFQLTVTEDKFAAFIGAKAQKYLLKFRKIFLLMGLIVYQQHGTGLPFSLASGGYCTGKCIYGLSFTSFYL